MRVDPNQKGGKRIQVTPQDVTTAGAAEAWMRAGADHACGFPQAEIRHSGRGISSKPEARQ